MQIDLIPILSTVILATTIVTIILAIGSYLAYKLRDKRRARDKRKVAEEPQPARVFRRYRPGEGTQEEHPASAEGARSQGEPQARRAGRPAVPADRPQGGKASGGGQAGRAGR